MPLAELRTFRLCTLLHCRPSELDEESAVTLDWLLAIEGAFNNVKRMQADRG